MDYFTIAVFFACGLMGILMGLYFGLAIQNFFYYRKVRKKIKRDYREAKALYPDSGEERKRKKRSIEYLVKLEEKRKKKEEKQEKREEKEQKRLEKQAAKEQKKEQREKKRMEKEAALYDFQEEDETAVEMELDEEEYGLEENREEEEEEPDLSAGKHAGEAFAWMIGKAKDAFWRLKEACCRKKTPSGSVLSRLENKEEGYISERCADYGEDVSEVLSRSMGSQDDSYNIIRRRKKEN